MPEPQPSELPPRPLPARRPSEFAGAWLHWFGVGRLAIGAVSLAVVAAGAVWLLRAPAPSTDAGLPVASVATTSSVTPVPTSAATFPASPPPGTAPATVVVHVAGAIASPGIYTLTTTARVADAVAAAGGAVADAELDALNLAAPVVDGERVYVPFVGDVDPADVASGPPQRAVASESAAGSTVIAGPLDLNAARADELEQLPGVGPATATAIVEDRQRNGPFASVDDLDRVTGIGAAKLETLRPLVTV